MRSTRVLRRLAVSVAAALALAAFAARLARLASRAACPPSDVLPEEGTTATPRASAQHWCPTHETSPRTQATQAAEAVAAVVAPREGALPGASQSASPSASSACMDAASPAARLGAWAASRRPAASLPAADAPARDPSDEAVPPSEFLHPALGSTALSSVKMYLLRAGELPHVVSTPAVGCVASESKEMDARLTKRDHWFYPRLLSAHSGGARPPGGRADGTAARAAAAAALTGNISEAALLLVPCGLYVSAACECAYAPGAASEGMPRGGTNHPSTQLLYWRRAMKELEAHLAAFRQLKARNIVRPDAWLVVEDLRLGPMATRTPFATQLKDKLGADTEALLRASPLADAWDLMLVGADNVAWGVHPGALGANDVNMALKRAPWYDGASATWLPAPTPDLTCDDGAGTGLAAARAAAPLLFFKGRATASWMSRAFFGGMLAHHQPQRGAAMEPDESILHSERGSSSLVMRVQMLRARIAAAVERYAPPGHRSSVEVYTRNRGRNFSAAAQAVDFHLRMGTAAFCLAPAGNNPFSFRLFEALEAACVPAVVSGGYIMPFSPALRWETLAVRLPEAWPYRSAEALERELWLRTLATEPSTAQPGEVARLCEAADDAAVRARALCRRRRRVRAAWQYVKTHELELWLGAVRLRWLLRQSVGRAPSDDDESVAVMQSLY